MRVGYIRRPEQEEDGQLSGVELDAVVEERCDCTTYERPRRDELVEMLKEGDSLHVASLDRIARDVNDAYTLIRHLVTSGVTVVCHAEEVLFDGDEGCRNATLAALHVMRATATMERRLQNERKRVGMARAREQGRRLGGPRTIDDNIRAEIRSRAATGEGKAALARSFGISRSQLYRILAEGPDKCGV